MDSDGTFAAINRDGPGKLWQNPIDARIRLVRCCYSVKWEKSIREAIWLPPARLDVWKNFYGAEDWEHIRTSVTFSKDEIMSSGCLWVASTGWIHISGEDWLGRVGSGIVSYF